MNARQRLQTALRHETPDRIPFDIGGSPVTGMHVSCVKNLRAYYGLPEKPVKVVDPGQMLGEIDAELKAILGIDTEYAEPMQNIFGFQNSGWKEWTMNSGQTVLVPKDFAVTRDESGNTLIYPRGNLQAKPSGMMPKDGYYFDSIVRQMPIDDDDLDPQDNLQEFVPIDQAAVDFYAEEAAALKKTGRGIVANFGGTALGDIALVPAPFLEAPKGIRDIEEWYVSAILRPGYVHAVFERQTEIALGNLQKIHQAVGNDIDVIYLCGTDFGTQISTFCSRETFVDLYMPYYRILNGWIHANTQWKTFKHSCGAISEFIPLLIESGFDILNPVQCSAAGMDPDILKRDFGDTIAFWGGGVDTQTTLAFGTPQQIRREVLQRCSIFSKHGGFVFAAVHNIQQGTPVENIVAMIDALREFNGR